MRLLLLIVPLSLATFQFWHFVSHQQSYVARRNPVAAVDFIQARRLPGPIYNRYGWGGYLIYRLYPEYRVFIDGRADVYGDEFFFQMANTYNGQRGWREPLDRYGIRTVFISPDVPLASLLRNDPTWQIAYEDDRAIIFTRVEMSVSNGSTRMEPLSFVD